MNEVTIKYVRPIKISNMQISIGHRRVQWV